MDWQSLTDEEVVKAYEKALADYDNEAQDAAAAEMERRGLDY